MEKKLGFDPVKYFNGDSSFNESEFGHFKKDPRFSGKFYTS